MKRLKLVLDVLVMIPKLFIFIFLTPRILLNGVLPMIIYAAGLVWMYHNDFNAHISLWEALKTGIWLGPSIVSGILLLFSVVIVLHILIKGEYPPGLLTKSKSPE